MHDDLALTLREYVAMVTNAGFGTVEIRARRPYPMLAPNQYDVPEPIFVESLEVCDKTAQSLVQLNRADIFISESTWFYDGGGCC